MAIFISTAAILAAIAAGATIRSTIKDAEMRSYLQGYDAGYRKAAHDAAVLQEKINSASILNTHGKN